MDVAWIEVLSELWKNDDEIDFFTLQKQYQLKTFERRGTEIGAPDNSRESLLICLTGFGDQRDEIAAKVEANGGSYTGDLTRRCTHLIVNKPEGKKFTAAKSWQIRTVTLEWVEQSIARGMILEEDKFDPLLPPSEQGVGAWIKKDPRKQTMAKRSRSDIGTEDGARKLRKTASMKLNSQRDNLWGDILGSRSKATKYSFAQESELEVKQEDRSQRPVQESQGIFANCIFYIHGFTPQRTSVLSQTVVSLSGTIASKLDAASASDTSTRFLIVPQTSQPETHPTVPENVQIVTEFYVEKCLHNRQFYPPQETHALGRPFPQFPIPGFEDLIICTAAFTGIELSQVVRGISQLGAKFDEQFRKTASVLVCKSLQAMRKEKLKLALSWSVPVVSADWLWECISTGFLAPIEHFIFPELRGRFSRKPSAVKPMDDKPLGSNPFDRSQKTSQVVVGIDTTAFDRDTPPKLKSTTTHVNEPVVSADFASNNESTEEFITAPKPATKESFWKNPDSFKRTKSDIPQGNPVPSLQRTKSAPGEAVAKQTTGEATEVTEKEIKAKEEEAIKQAKALEKKALTTTIKSHLFNDTEPPEAPRQRHRKIFGRATSNVSDTSVQQGSTGVMSGSMVIDGCAGVNGSGPMSGPVVVDASGGMNASSMEGDAEPPSTQLGYADPEAQKSKAKLLSRMRGSPQEEKRGRKQRL